jgi:hypothetical protein
MQRQSFLQRRFERKKAESMKFSISSEQGFPSISSVPAGSNLGLGKNYPRYDLS